MEQQFIAGENIMWKYFFRLSVFILLIFTVACSAQLTPENETHNPTELPATETLLSTPIQVSTATPAPQLTATPIPEPTVTTLAVITALPPADTVVEPECPPLTNNLSQHAWSNGAVLFNTGEIVEGTLWWPQVEQDGIWAISADSLDPQLVYQPAKNVTVSPDGTTLASFKPVPEGSLPILVLYSMITDESVDITMPPIIGEPMIGQYPTWLPDGRIAYVALLERNLGAGEVWDVVIVDPTTRAVERSTLELNLPEYEFYEYDTEWGIPSGFVAVDPTYQRVLYTAGDGQNHEIRLLDIATGEILWKEQSEYLINTSPQWAQDGQQVLFEVAILRQDIPSDTSGDGEIPFAWGKLISLTRDGEEEELSFKPFPGLLDHLVNNFSRSPDGRYIFYNFFSNETSSIHAYIVDTAIGESAEICDPQSHWFGSWPLGSADSGEVEVHWLSNDRLIYRTLVERGGQWAHSLRILNIPEWTSQVIYEGEPGHGTNVFGWTPVEFSK